VTNKDLTSYTDETEERSLILWVYRRNVPEARQNRGAYAVVYTPASYDNGRPYEFHVAPMQGYTNAPLRYFFRLLSPDAVLWTEMEKVRDLKEAMFKHSLGDGLWKRFGAPTDQWENNPITLQLGGDDPHRMRECVKRLCQSGYIFPQFNLNCGCPSIEAGGADFGASLMKQPDLTRQLIQAIGDGCSGYKLNGNDCTVSLKSRIAVFETPEEMELAYSATSNKNIVQEFQFQNLCSYISQAEKGGLSHLVLHARPAVLSGLSPTKNRLVPPLDYEIVERVAAEFPQLQVTLNGGIDSLDCLAQLRSYQRCCGTTKSCIQSHMAGRWMLQRPLDLAFVQKDFFAKMKNDHTPTDIILSALEKYLQYAEEHAGEKGISVADLCIPLYLVIEQLREDYMDEDEMMMTQDDLDKEGKLYDKLVQILTVLSDLVPGGRRNKPLRETINWKRLSSSMKDLVPSKICSKCRRNRCELLKKLK
jgi:tRNA-dihydrouridine synthase A